MFKQLKELENISLPKWESLSNDGIYKEELLTYLREVLKPLYVVDNNLITSSMINNYVKLGYITKPEKKRYFRESIAQLIVISIFKQIITIEDIAKGIEIEISTFGIKEVYENFVNIFQEARDIIFVDENKDQVDISFKYQNHHDKVLYFLAISLFTKLYTKVVIDNR